MQAVRCGFSFVNNHYLTAQLAHRVRAEPRRQVQTLLVSRLAGENRVHPGRVLHCVQRVQQSLSQDRYRYQLFFLVVAYQVALVCQGEDVHVRQCFDYLFRIWKGHNGRQRVPVQRVVEEAHRRAHQVRETASSKLGLPVNFQVRESPVLLAQLLNDFPRPLLRKDTFGRVLELRLL